MPTRWRRRSINAIILGVIGMQLAVVARGGERWPVTPYAMYASEHRGEISWYQVYGVTGTGEFPLDRYAYHPPLDDPRLSFSFAPRPERANTVRADTGEMLRVVGRLYERARRSGQHDGPVLQGLRVYRVTWLLDPIAANRAQPDQMVLLGEVATGE
jgi:hypothetical protein